MNPVRLVSVSLVAALALTTVTASAGPKGSASKSAAPKAVTPIAATPKAATPKKAQKKAQKAPQKLETPVEPPVEVAGSLPMPAEAPTPVADPAPAAAPSVAPPAKDAPASESKESPEGERPFSVAPLLGYSTNALNVGVGLRAGYTLKNKIYIGASFVYQHGLSSDSGLGASSYSFHVFGFYPSVEVGYEIQAGQWTLRPYGGVGVFFTKFTSSSDLPAVKALDLSSTSLALYPGFSALYNIPGSGGFIGGDARLLIAGSASLGGFVTGGLRF